MKKILFAVVVCMAMFAFTACEEIVTGDRIYCVDADANGQGDAVLTNYAVFAYPTIEKKINEIAKSPIYRWLEVFYRKWYRLAMRQEMPSRNQRRYGRD